MQLSPGGPNPSLKYLNRTPDFTEDTLDRCDEGDTLLLGNEYGEALCDLRYGHEQSDCRKVSINIGSARRSTRMNADAGARDKEPIDACLARGEGRTAVAEMVVEPQMHAGLVLDVDFDAEIAEDRSSFLDHDVLSLYREVSVVKVEEVIVVDALHRRAF